MLTLLLGTLTAWVVAPANPLVAPGRSLGNLVLGAPAATLATLGPAAVTDAAMQKAWATWYGGNARQPTQLDVYTAATGPSMRKTVQAVRATSAFFHTVGGLRSGFTLAAIRQACGPLVAAGSYVPAPGRPPHYFYDNVWAGIAFETDGTAGTSHCTALIVHLPGQPLATGYLPLPAYLTALPRR